MCSALANHSLTDVREGRHMTEQTYRMPGQPSYRSWADNYHQIPGRSGPCLACLRNRGLQLRNHQTSRTRRISDATCDLAAIQFDGPALFLSEGRTPAACLIHLGLRD